jgi:hypothetical protein
MLECKMGKMSGVGGDKAVGPPANVRELDDVRARSRKKRSLPASPAAPTEPPTPDRAAALSMLSTFDLDDVAAASADDVLAAIEHSAALEGDVGSATAVPVDDRGAAAPAADDRESDEILRELEQHHQRTQSTPSNATPRGSAALARGSARKAQPAWRQRRSPTSKRAHRGPRPLPVVAAALAVLCAVVGATAIPGQHRPLRNPSRAPRASTLTALTTGSAGTPGATVGHGTTSAAVNSRQSSRDRSPGKVGARRHDAERAARHNGSAASTHPSSARHEQGSDATSGTTSSYVSSSSTPSTNSPSSSASDAAGPAGLGSEVGNNCNPKCS